MMLPKQLTLFQSDDELAKKTYEISWLPAVCTYTRLSKLFLVTMRF